MLRLIKQWCETGTARTPHPPVATRRAPPSPTGRGAVLAALLLLFSVAAHAQRGPDWDKLAAAARTEGQLTISAPSGSAWRDQIMAFERDFPGIRLSVTPVASRDFWPRVIKEREAGQKLWDFRIGGPDHTAYQIKNMGGMSPIRPLLLPEIADPAQWWGGLDGIFLDKEKQYFLGFAVYEENIGYHNAKLVPPEMLPDMQALLDPQWKGKISMADPRAGSPLTGSAALLRFYGEDYLRQLMGDQRPVIVKEPRQQMEWLAGGRYPISLGVPSIAFVEYAARGVAIDGLRKIPGPKTWTQGVGGFQMPEGAPHPNAAKLYINWMLTPEVQRRLMPAVKLNGRHKDVPLGDPETAVDYADIEHYIGAQTELQQPYQSRAAAILRELLR